MTGVLYGWTMRALVGSLLMAMGTTGCAATSLSPDEDEAVADDEGDVSAQVGSAIVGGNAESTENAVVQLLHGGSACTGTLIRPDVVLTNGHCIRGIPLSARGAWRELPSTEGDIRINVGSVGTRPTFSTTTRWVNQPRTAADGAGHDDVALVGLTTAVPAEHARWLRVATNAPGVDPVRIGSSTTATAVGWGEFYWGRATGRVAGTMTRILQSCPGQDNMRGGDWTPGMGPYVQGDSGSPVLIDGRRAGISGNAGPVVVGVMGNGSCGGGGYLATWASGSASKPDIGAWLTETGTRSFCAQRQSMRSRDGRHRRLNSWWSQERLDNIATSQDGYSGCFANWTDVAYPGGPYGFYHQEGWVADAALPPPAGTVPLYLYWDSSSEDNATATAAFAPPAPWSRGPLLGHVWTTPAPGRVALRLWYSAARKDYLTTTRTLDLTSEGYTRVGTSGIIGYVRTAGSLD